MRRVCQTVTLLVCVAATGLAQPQADPRLEVVSIKRSMSAELRWTPDGTGPPADDAPPTLGTALREQLGLKLEADTMPLDFLVIDAAERPAEN
jgi:uncharacterized protein (TIGR03435 family)